MKKQITRILKIVCLALTITVFGLMFYSPMLITKSFESLNLNFTHVFFGAPLAQAGSIAVSYNPAVGGFIGFMFVLFGGVLTLLSAEKVTKKNRVRVVIINFVGITFSLVGCLLIFLIANMFMRCNPNLVYTYTLSTVTLVAGFIGILEAIIASVTAIIDFNQKK